MHYSLFALVQMKIIKSRSKGPNTITHEVTTADFEEKLRGAAES